MSTYSDMLIDDNNEDNDMNDGDDDFVFKDADDVIALEEDEQVDERLAELVNAIAEQDLLVPSVELDDTTDNNSRLMRNLESLLQRAEQLREFGPRAKDQERARFSLKELWKALDELDQVFKQEVGAGAQDDIIASNAAEVQRAEGMLRTNVRNLRKARTAVNAAIAQREARNMLTEADQQAYDSIIELLDRRQETQEELEMQMAQLKQQLEDKEAESRQIERMFENVALVIEEAASAMENTQKQEDASCTNTEGRVVAQQARPCVRVLDFVPPVFDRRRFGSARDMQQAVGRSALRQLRGGEGCSKPGEPADLTLAQKVVVHYMLPQSPFCNLLLNHAAGSGKTTIYTLVASVWARMGWKTLIITKKELSHLYHQAAFEQGADYNVQQYLRWKGVTSVAELVAKEGQNISVGVRGQMIWKEMMGTANMPEVMTFQMVANLAKEASRDRANRLLRRDPKQRSPFYRTLIIIDEVHKQTAYSPDLVKQASGDILALTEALWKARSVLPPKDGPRVLAGTATPVVDSIVDAVATLNLLTMPPRGGGGDGGGGVVEGIDLRKLVGNRKGSFLELKPLIEEAFLRQPALRAKVELMFKGTVSYWDPSGDPSRFGRPVPAKFNTPRLSEQQYNAMRKCAQNGKDCSARAVMWATGPGSLSQVRKLRDLGFAADKRPVRSRRGAREQQDGGGELSLKDISKLRTAMAQKAPLVKQLLEHVRLAEQNALKRLQALKQQQGSTSGMNGIKQMIFCDLGKSRDDDAYGVDLVAALMKLTMGFRDYRSQFATKYRSLLVLGAETTPSERVAGLRKFNSSNNVDGRDISVVLVSGKYKEGVSLSDVGYVHLVGEIKSDADLEQAMRRALRNCRSQHLPMSEQGQRKVRLVFVNTSSLIRQKIEPTRKEKMAEWATHKFSGLAVDRELLSRVNDDSAMLRKELLQSVTTLKLPSPTKEKEKRERKLKRQRVVPQKSALDFL